MTTILDFCEGRDAVPSSGAKGLGGYGAAVLWCHSAGLQLSYRANVLRCSATGLGGYGATVLWWNGATELL